VYRESSIPVHWSQFCVLGSKSALERPGVLSEVPGSISPLKPAGNQMHANKFNMDPLNLKPQFRGHLASISLCCGGRRWYPPPQIPIHLYELLQTDSEPPAYFSCYLNPEYTDFFLNSPVHQSLYSSIQLMSRALRAALHAWLSDKLKPSLQWKERWPVTNKTERPTFFFLLGEADCLFNLATPPTELPY
jgi:hypothetical protein